MKKSIIVAYISALLCVACTTTQTDTLQTATQAETQLQQVASAQCPIITSALTTLTALQGIPENTATALAAADAAAKTVCTDVSTVNATSLQTLITSVTPVILDAAKSAGLAAAQQNDIVLAVGTAQTLIQVAIQEQQLSATPAK